MDNLTEAQVKCLNSWPEGTAGYLDDEQLITLVNMLCHRHGYELVCGLGKRIEDGWRNKGQLSGLTEQEVLALGGEEQLSRLFYLLCSKYGYGRVGQLCLAIEQIWRDPVQGQKDWQEFRDTRMGLLKGTMAYYAARREGKTEEEANRLAAEAGDEQCQ
jgi:hypothetical protein